VLAVVDLDAIDHEGRRLAAEQPRALDERDARTAPLELDARRQAGEARTDDGDHRRGRHRAAIHDRAMTLSFTAGESDARLRRGSCGSASIRSRMRR